MAINLKDYNPALMQGANIDISLGDVIIDDLTVGDDATITGDLAVTGTSVFTGAVDVDSTTDTTSGTTGALKVAGGVGIEKALYVGTTATSGGDTLSGFTTTDASNLSKYQFVVNASGAGETITLTRFYARIDIWLSLKKESKTVGRLTNPIEPGVQRPRGSGGR